MIIICCVLVWCDTLLYMFFKLLLTEYLLHEMTIKHAGELFKSINY